MANENDPAKKQLIITRIVKAPRQLVFEIITQSEHLSHWWGPKGMKLTVHFLSLKPGGKFFYSIQNDDGFTMYGMFVYREIVSPQKIVFVSSFADENGNTIRAPFSSTWPLEVMNTWVLTEQDGETNMLLTGEAYNANEEEENTFTAMFPQMQEGFGGTLGQLADYIATL
jgi:uncharacterized protein YndB with AHSA1/START domain